MADKGKSIDEKTASEQYAIGSGLLTWLHNNQLIEIHNPLVEVDLSEHKELPMVSPPRDWKNRRASKWVKASDMNRLTHKARDLSGGYLNSEGAVSRKTTLLSSKKDEGSLGFLLVEKEGMGVTFLQTEIEELVLEPSHPIGV
ncbi:hypothetical protein ZEAMMB73_Zm00001d040879 [Zea mays]|uniref:Uncharacterized protein n=1 Tax=Zea mays TaxID=4577 RepID=A0A1D6MTG1_MAIZE|nr:hypothetical protein ZEAMMB73_Zm00001d040879 [Zea mays]